MKDWFVIGEVGLELGDKFWGEDGEMVLASAGSEVISARENWEDKLGVLGVVDRPEGTEDGKELGGDTSSVLDGMDCWELAEEEDERLTFCRGTRIEQRNEIDQKDTVGKEEEAGVDWEVVGNMVEWGNSDSWNKTSLEM